MEYLMYYPDKSEVESLDTFFKYYSRFYFWLNSKTVEDTVIKLFSVDRKFTDEDVLSILAWKTGHISHNKSESDKYDGIVYYSGWENPFDLKINGDKKIDIKSIIKKLGRLKTDNVSDFMDKEALSNVVDRYIGAFSGDNKVDGVAPVTLITLMSFNERGYIPIYDRFAWAGLWSICKNKGEYKDLTFDNMKNKYLEYCDSLAKVFSDAKIEGDIDIKLRIIDQALWTYGHCFFVQNDFRLI